MEEVFAFAWDVGATIQAVEEAVVTVGGPLVIEVGNRFG